MTDLRSFRALLEEPSLLIMPTAHDALTARLVERAGFRALLVPKGVVSNYLCGLPDLGLLDTSELVAQVARITAVTELPVLVDIDDGDGTPASVHRAVRLCESAGASAVLLEDAISSGKHQWDDLAQGWNFSNEPIRSREAAVELVEAAVAARRNPDTVVIARTDTLLVTSLDDAIERVAAYAHAGADVVYVVHLPDEDIAAVHAAIPVPLFSATVESPTPVERDALFAAGLAILTCLGATWVSPFEATVGALRDLQDGVRDALVPLGSTQRAAPILDAVDLEGWTRRLHGVHTEGGTAR